MTLVDKVNITTGVGWSQGLCVGNTAPANSVDFYPLCLQDGPLGLRFADHSTAFPAGVTVGATWNRDLMYQRGRAGGPNFSSWTKDKIGHIHEGNDDKTTAEVNKFVDVQGTGKDFHGIVAQNIAAEGTVLVKERGQNSSIEPKGPLWQCW